MGRRVEAAISGYGMGSHQALCLCISEEGHAAIDMQFFITLVQVHFDGALADRQSIGDGFIAQAAGCEANDFKLTWR